MIIEKLSLLMFCVAYVANAQYMTTAELSSESYCYNLPVSTPMYSKTPVGGYPGEAYGATIYAGTLQTSSLRIQCLEVFFARSPSLSAAEATTCLNHGWNLYACTVDVATGVESCNVTVNSAFIFNASVRPTTWTDADTNFNAGALFTLKLRWLPNVSTPASCYPMYFTTVIVEENSTAESKSSIAAVIVFILLAGVVLVVLGCFGRYQLRKVLSKFGKKISTKSSTKSEHMGADNSLPPTHTSFYDDNNDENELDNNQQGKPFDQGDEEFRAQFGAHAIRSVGPQRAELVDGVRVSSRPLIQPWYERNSFVSPEAKRHPQQQVEVHQQQRLVGGPNGAAPLAMQVAHIMGPDSGNNNLYGVRRRQPSPLQDRVELPGPGNNAGAQLQQQLPIYMDPSVNVSMQYGGGGGAAVYDEPPQAGPRRLQFPSPVHVAHEQPQYSAVYTGSSQQARVLNPYED